jgi:RNase P/RNase MRP subunit p29
MLSKKNATSIRFSIDSGSCFISGSSLIGRPEDRISRRC